MANDCKGRKRQDDKGNFEEAPRSVFDPEVNRYFGTLIQSSRTERKYDYTTNEELNIADREIEVSSTKRVKKGDRVQIRDDRGNYVFVYLENVDTNTNIVTFDNPIKEFFDKDGNSKTSGHISKNANFTFMKKHVPWYSSDENLRSSSLFTFIHRTVSSFATKNGTTSSNNGFEPVGDDLRNNFIISRGKSNVNNNIENAGRYYINGLQGLVTKDVFYFPENPDQFEDSKQILPQTSKLFTNPDFSSEGILVDNHAQFPVDKNGKGTLKGRELILGLDTLEPFRYPIKDNTETKIFVDYERKNDQDNKVSLPIFEEVATTPTYYRVGLSDPEESRTDSIYLNLFLDEVGPTEDNDIYALKNGRKRTASQSRLKLRQRIEVREEGSPDIYYQGQKDNAGAYHAVVKIGEINRPKGNAFISDGQIADVRNVFRELSEVGLENLLFNSQFELTDDIGNNFEFIDWVLEKGSSDVNLLARTDSFVQNGDQSAELAVTNYVNDVAFYQIYSGTQLIDSIFRGRDLTFSIDIAYLEDQNVTVRPFIKSLSSSGGDEIEYGNSHTNKKGFERRTVSKSIRDVDIDDILVGVEIQGEGAFAFDSGTLVYGNFSEVSYFRNKEIDELALIRDEVHDARRSSQKNQNYQDLDSRLEDHDDEIYIARDSNNFNQSFSRLKDRIDNYEGQFLFDHNPNPELHDNFIAKSTVKGDWIKAISKTSSGNDNFNYEIDFNSELINGLENASITTNNRSGEGPPVIHRENLSPNLIENMDDSLTVEEKINNVDCKQVTSLEMKAKVRSKADDVDETLTGTDRDEVAYKLDARTFLGDPNDRSDDYQWLALANSYRGGMGSYAVDTDYEKSFCFGGDWYRSFSESGYSSGKIITNFGLFGINSFEIIVGEATGDGRIIDQNFSVPVNLELEAFLTKEAGGASLEMFIYFRPVVNILFS